MEATNTIEMQAETLSGDIRDRFLDVVRLMNEPWTKLSELDQKKIISKVDGLSRDTIRDVVDVVAHGGFPHMSITASEWTVKDGIKMKVSAAETVENITKLASHSGRAIMVLADPAAFFGERAPAKFDKDQPDLPATETEIKLDLKELDTGEGDSDAEEDGEAETEETEAVEAAAPTRRRRRSTKADAPEAPEMPADPTREAVDA